ncbi:MAG: NTP transferase domain-containing protein, partial [Candidatus Omnitrophica bacterium]|nr:NTP transferase domain-containing protein [Candidatus Omnitrophota bacterium]
MDKVTAVVLAAGLGTRMKSDLPKVLHPIGSSTVLGKVISNLDKAGIKDIIVVVGHKAELIEKLFEGKARFVRQPELVGSGDALA